MPIQIADFRGMIPKIDPEKLPDNAAQLALNCDLTSGSLKPINVTGPFLALHDNTKLRSEIPENDAARISKPPKLSANPLDVIDVTEWLKIKIYGFVSYVSSEPGFEGQYVTKAPYYGYSSNYFPRDMGLSVTRRTDDTIEVMALLWGFFRFRIFNGGPYFFRAPRYQFVFKPPARRPLVAPESGENFYPMSVIPASPLFSSEKVPLLDSRTNNIFAWMQCVDVVSPVYDQDFYVEEYDYIDMNIPPSIAMTATFIFKMYYTNPSRRHFFFVQTYTRGTGDDAPEGPPGEISDKITVLPGQKLFLPAIVPPQSKVRLYRSETGSDDFVLMDELKETEYYDIDSRPRPIGDPIPPFGNVPGTISVADFLVGSVLHPAHFGVAKYGKEVWFSDRYRLHAWPKEYVVPLDDKVMALAVTGNTVLALTATKTYAITGAHPERMSRYIISEDTPLLRDLGITRIGNTVFWPTTNGIAASSGESVKIITSDYITREIWQAFHPEKMVGKSAENSLFFECLPVTLPQKGPVRRVFMMQMPNNVPPPASTSVHVRFDTQEGRNALSLYTHYSGRPYVWHSKQWRFQQKTQFDFVRIGMEGEGTVSLEIFYDGETTGSEILITGSKTEYIGGRPCHVIEFRLSGTVPIKEIELYDRRITTIGTDGVRFSNENTPCWRNMWVRFPDQGRFAYGVLSMQNRQTATVNFYTGNVRVHSQTVEGGRPFKLPRTMPMSNLWRVEIEGEDRVEELFLKPYAPQPTDRDIVQIHSGTVPQWLGSCYETLEPRTFSSLIVHANRPVTMRLYAENAAAPSASIQITDSREISLADVAIPVCRRLEFDFSDDAAVEQVLLFTDSPEVVGNAAVRIQSGRRNRRMVFPNTGRFRTVTVYADTGKYRVRIWADDTIVFDQEMTPGNTMTIPVSAPYAKQWRVDCQTVEGDHGTVDAVVLTPEIVIQVPDRDDNLIAAGDASDAGAWRSHEFRLVGSRILTSVWADVTAPVVMKLYLDGKSAPEQIHMPASGEYPVRKFISAARIIVAFHNAAGKDASHNVRAWRVFGGIHAQTGTEFSRTAMPFRNFRVAFPEPSRWVAARVLADNETRLVLSRIVGDGESAIIEHDENVRTQRFFALPRTIKSGEKWRVDVSPVPDDKTTLIQSLDLLSVRAEQAGTGIFVIRGDNVPQWLWTRWEFAEGVYPAFIEIVADVYPLLAHIYCDNAESPQYIIGPVTAENRAVPILNTARPEDKKRSFEVRIFGAASAIWQGQPMENVPADHLVRQMRIGAAETYYVNGVISLRAMPFWRGMRFWFPHPGVFAAMQVAAYEYKNITVVLYADGKEVYRRPVTDGKAFRLPHTLPKASLWILDIHGSGADAIESVILAPLVTAVVEGGILHRHHPPGQIPAWMYEQYELPDVATLAGAIVHDAETMNIMTDSNTMPVSVDCDGSEVSLADVPKCSRFRLGFPETPGEVILYTTQDRMVGREPVVIEQRYGWRNMRMRFAEASRFMCAMLDMDDYRKGRATITMFADGHKVAVKKVSKPDIVVFENMPVASEWIVDVAVEGGARATKLILWPELRMQMQNGIFMTHDGLSAPPWLYITFVMPEPLTILSGSVNSRKYNVKMSLNGRNTIFVSGKEQRISTTPPSMEYRVMFHGMDDEVREFRLYAEQFVPVEPWGIILRGTEYGTSWGNKVLRFGDTGTFRYARVISDAPVKIYLRPHGTIAWTHREISGPDIVPISPRFSLPNSRDWDLFVEHDMPITELHLFAHHIRPFSGTIILRRDQEPWTWIDKHFISERDVEFSAARIRADIYPVKLNIYRENSIDPDVVVSVTSPEAFRVPKITPARKWRIDVTGAPEKQIHEVAISTSMEGLRRG